MSSAPAPILEIKNLEIIYTSRYKGLKTTRFRAVHNVSFSVFTGETLAIVGESGCGKTSIAMALLGLLRPDRGEIYFKGLELWNDSQDTLPLLRADIQPVFQDFSSSLNPHMTIQQILREAINSPVSDRTKAQTIASLLTAVRLAPETANRFPHQLSGGQKQRVNIARALAVHPKFLLLDEPISSQDLSHQAQLIRLLQRLKGEYRLGYLLITHNLRIVRLLADRVLIMRNGRIIERGPAEAIFKNPKTEYTNSMLSCFR